MEDAAGRELSKSLELAEDLNAEIVALDAQQSATRLRDLIASRRIDHVVLAGEPRQLLQRLRRTSLLDGLMRDVPGLTAHVVSTSMPNAT